MIDSVIQFFIYLIFEVVAFIQRGGNFEIGCNDDTNPVGIKEQYCP